MAETCSVLVKNLSKDTTVNDITTFFSFCGNIVEIRISEAENETNQAIVTFEAPYSVSTAELMTGAILKDNRIEIAPTTVVTPVETSQVFAGNELPERTIPEVPSTQTKTSAVASAIAAGYVLAEGTFQKAVEFDRTHGISDSIKNAAISVDEKLHLTEYLALGATLALSYAQDVDNRYEISKTVADTCNKIDDKLGVSEKLTVAQDAIDNGLQKVKNSTPVQAVSSTVNTFSEEVKSDINQRKGVAPSQADFPAGPQPIPEDDPFTPETAQPVERTE